MLFKRIVMLWRNAVKDTAHGNMYVEFYLT